MECFKRCHLAQYLSSKVLGFSSVWFLKETPKDEIKLPCYSLFSLARGRLSRVSPLRQRPSSWGCRYR
nr:MAG TPA: hypothetical protein [Microviridae sp.]